MADNTNLIPAAELAAKSKVHFPNESPECRQARNGLREDASIIGGRVAQPCLLGLHPSYFITRYLASVNIHSIVVYPSRCGWQVRLNPDAKFRSSAQFADGRRDPARLGP